MSRVEELNERIYNRNRGDIPQFYFSPRPVPTKYTTMPIVDERRNGAPIQCQPVFDTSRFFLPGTSAPWSGKVDTIDTESDLFRPIHYFPTSQSDLFVIPYESIPSTFHSTIPSVQIRPTGNPFNNSTSLKYYSKRI